MFTGGTLEAKVSFKLRQASPAGGTLAREKPNHPSLLTNLNAAGGGGCSTAVNTIVRVDGLLDQDKMQYVLDSGAALSVVRYDTVNPAYHQHIQTDGISAAVGANGLPLDIIGRFKLPVRLKEFQWDQEFTVVKNLTVACLLGAEFLIKHGAIVDCKSGRLSLGQVHLPITMGSACGITNIDLSIRMADTTDQKYLPNQSC